MFIKKPIFLPNGSAAAAAALRISYTLGVESIQIIKI